MIFRLVFTQAEAIHRLGSFKLSSRQCFVCHGLQHSSSTSSAGLMLGVLTPNWAANHPAEFGLSAASAYYHSDSDCTACTIQLQTYIRATLCGICRSQSTRKPRQQRKAAARRAVQHDHEMPTIALQWGMLLESTIEALQQVHNSTIPRKWVAL